MKALLLFWSVLAAAAPARVEAPRLELERSVIPAGVQTAVLPQAQIELPRLEESIRELPAAARSKARALYNGEGEDGSKIRGAWKDSDVSGAQFDGSRADLPPELAIPLEEVSRLRPSEVRVLLKRLEKADLNVRGPPDFSDRHTFSFEYELLVNRQLKKMNLRRLFADDPLSWSERLKFKRQNKLSPGRWKEAFTLVSGRLIERMPKGWRIFHVGRGNTLELNTGNSKGSYHENKPEDWAELTAGLTRVQDALPAGLYSVHLHNGHQGLREGHQLRMDPDRFARVTKVYEAMWRALAGFGYRKPTDPKIGDNQISYLELSALAPAQTYESMDKQFIGLSDDFPTIETRIITGLLDKEGKLNPQKLAGEVWWTFAMMEAFAGDDPFDLATMGLPVTAGLVPSRKQMLYFADRIYGNDLVGKALALQRISKVTFNGGRAMSLRAKTVERRAIKRAYEDLGLGVVHRLHARADGIDAHLIRRLREDGLLRAELAADLADVWGHDEAALYFFPDEFHPQLEAEIQKQMEERSWPRRAWTWVKQAAGSVRRAWFEE